MNKSIETTIKFEEFHKICRFCFETNIVLYPLFDGNDRSNSATEHIGNFFSKSFGLEVYKRYENVIKFDTI